jgi:beta-lactamase superfamily II metal-dependent hydrolase
MNRVWLSSLVGALALLAAACGESGPVEPGPPVITIQGVTDGQVSLDPVTIVISVDRGSFEARLNGAPFTSGTTVAEPGDYTLAVTARAGVQTAAAQVHFALSGTSLLIVRVLDLGANEDGGGGDAILLTDSSAQGSVHALVDAGPAGSNAGDPGYVARRLQQLGVDTLAFLLLTHAHEDHFLGMIPVFNAVTVNAFYYNGQVRSLASYQSVIARAQADADSVIVPDALREIALGHDTAVTRFLLIPPLPDSLGVNTNSGSALNNGSLGVLVRRGSFELFLTGDGEIRANQRWMNSFAAYTGDVDALKAGHHGANDAIFDNGFSGASAWLAHVNPALALVSANGTSHPRENALNALLARPGLRTVCTNTHGAIEVRINPAGAYRVDVAANPAAACEAGTTP